MQVIPFIIGGEQPAMCLANVPVYRERDLGGDVIYAIPGIYVGSLGIRRDISCAPAVWTTLSETTMFFLI